MLEIEGELKKSIIGQEIALEKIAKSIRRNRVGIRNPKKPIGTFMFLGPTGVGKTHIAKRLAEYLFGDEDSLIRLDMSEFQEKHSISRLIGSPPGYVGHGDGGQLTEKVRRRPYSIVLFDEIEKANKEIYNTLLQLLDDGQLTDSSGRKVNFKNCMVIMTSNVGVKKLQDFGTGVGFGTKSKLEREDSIKESLLTDELKKQFPPEFLNRLDDVIIFKSLTKEEIGKIVDLELVKLKKRVGEIGYNLIINKTVRDYLIDDGYSEDYGARPLNRAIQKHIEDPISEEILSGNVKDNGTIKISYSKAKDEIIIKSE
jgi:ATP-dependent Clp protease ATP-binding subunit ClpC